MQEFNFRVELRIAGWLGLASLQGKGLGVRALGMAPKPGPS